MALKPKKYSGPTPIGEMLDSFLRTSMPKGMGEELQVFGAWPKAVGADISRQAVPTGFKGGILFVEAGHPMWITELFARRHTLLRKLNETIGKEIVREIYFRQKRL